MRQIRYLVLFALITLSRCDNLFVVNYPEDGLAFTDKVQEVKSSQLESLLDTVSGVTSAKGSWEGARVLSPFRYPLLVSLVAVQVAEPLPAAERWQHYAVRGDCVDVDTAFYKLDVRMSKQANTLPAVKLDVDQDETAVPPSAGPLNSSEPAHQPLLRELALLAGAGAELSAQPGRRAVLLSLSSLPALADDPAAAAAGALLREAVQTYAEKAAAATGGRAVTLLVTQPARSRRARSLLAAEKAAKDDGPDRNIASSYTDNYPAIFNILLITSLFLLYVLVTFSIMTAYMDPGKDSIIYRMTNPNMKKNN